MQRLFVYGTLMFPQVVGKILGCQLHGEYARLHGFARYCLVKRVYPGIVREPSSTVNGVLYHGLTPKHLRLLDRYEDRCYVRRRVEVTQDSGDHVEAWAYVIPAKNRRVLSTNPWLRDVFAARHLKRFLNASSR